MSRPVIYAAIAAAIILQLLSIKVPAGFGSFEFFGVAIVAGLAIFGIVVASIKSTCFRLVAIYLLGAVMVTDFGYIIVTGSSLLVN